MKCNTCNIILDEKNCGIDKRRGNVFYKNCNDCRKNKPDFFTKAKLIHGDKYDYSKVEYKNNKTNIVIICKIHGEFKQRPDNHLGNKCGCPICARLYSNTLTSLDTQTFIINANIAHNNKYDYSKVEYKNNKTKVIIICKIHGEFTQKPNSHVSSRHGCPICANKQKVTNEDFITKARLIHGDIYDYSEIKYVNNHTKIIIVCSIHGIFEQTPNIHLRGSGCPSCKSSKLETKFITLLNHLEIKFETQKRFKECRDVCPLPFDFSLSHNNNIILVELQGIQHYQDKDHFNKKSSFEDRRRKDKLKFTYAYQNHYFLSISYLCINFLEDILNNFLNIYENYEHFAQFYLTSDLYVSYSNVEIDYPKIDLLYLDLFQHVNHNLYDEKYYACHLCNKEYHYDLLELHYETEEHRDLYNKAKELESKNEKLLDNGLFLIYEE